MRLLAILFSTMLLFGCKAAEQLVLHKQDKGILNKSLTNSLRVDGYFYSPYQDGYCAFFLFKNGNYFDKGALLKVYNLEDLDLRIDKARQSEHAKKLYYRWGIFRVENSTILINRWLVFGSCGPYPSQLLDR